VPGVPRILVVENDDKLRRLMAAALSHAGYEAEGVGDGAAAQRRLSKPRFAVAVVDLLLPRVSGFALLAWLDRRPDAERPRVIIVSGGGRDMTGVDAISRARMFRHDAFLYKPFTLPELLATVGRVTG
jgi:DNA-binding response OmpR family regulator